MSNSKITALRMERQFLTTHADIKQYTELYHDVQPAQSVYWNGFGDPPSLTFRADFNDIEFNRLRQAKRELIKGRFASGYIGWITRDDLELYACLYRKPLTQMTLMQSKLLELIERAGPMNIQQMKRETGLLVKEITTILHRMQQAFIIYEDQYDGGMDRGWYMLSEIFPDANFKRYTKSEALKIVLKRFAYRNVVIDKYMAKSFFKLPSGEISIAISELVNEGVFVAAYNGFMLREDAALLSKYEAKPVHSVYAVHRNDFLYKSNEHILKDKFKSLCQNLNYDCDMLQYLLIDGEFHGACVGHFRNGPYDLNDVVCDLPDAQERKSEIINAISAVNYGKKPSRFMGSRI